ncbi:MAG: alpha/beta fold hydrolase [Paracoccaceae bacterium]
MRIKVGGIRLYVDIEGSGLVADGPQMHEKPTLILVHGGPGADHAIYKPGFGRLSDLCQIVYYDQRGNGRSDDGDPADWCLDTWADDLKELCDILGIERPVVFGASFGGVVAQAYATRYPDHPRALVLASTTAQTDFGTIYEAFEQLGGAEAGAVARAYWSNPTPEGRAAYFETCLPLYGSTPPEPNVMRRVIIKNDVALHYNGPSNEQGRFDFREALAKVTCPTLVINGTDDPIMPMVFSETLAASLPNAQHHIIENAAHMLPQDQPTVFFSRLETFIKEVSDAA